MGAYLEVNSPSLENGLPTPKAINSHSTVGNVPGNKYFLSFNILSVVISLVNLLPEDQILANTT